MASKQAVDLAQLIIASSGAAGSVKGGLGGDMVNFLANQIDAAIELAKETKGKPNPAVLTIVLAKKGWAIGGLVAGENQLGKCMSSVGSLSLSIAGAAASSPTGLGVVAFGVSALADAYSIYDSCPAAANQVVEKVAQHPTTIRLYHEMMNYFQVPMGLR